MIRLHALPVCLVATLAMTSCGGSSAPASESPTPASGSAQAAQAPAPDEENPADVEVPDDLLGMVVMRHPVQQVRGVAELVNAVRPGSGDTLEAGGLIEELTREWGGLPASGFDLEKPMYLLYVDGLPRAPLVLVAALANRAAVEAALAEDAGLRVRRGYAAIGAPEALARVAEYGLTGLRDQRLPVVPTLVLRLEPIMERYGAAFTSAMLAAQADGNEVTRRVMEAYVLSLVALGQQSRTARISVAASSAGVTLHLEADAKPGTTLAAFARSQRPGDYALVKEIAAPDDAVVVGGRLDYSALQGAFEDFWALLFSLSDGDTVPIEEMRAVTGRWIEMFRDEFAMSGRFDSHDRLALTMRSRVSDDAAARGLIKDWYALIERYPAAFKYRAPRIRTVRQGDTEIFVLRAAFEASPEERAMFESLHGPELEVAMAVSEGRLSVATGQGAQGSLRALLAGRGAPAGEIAVVADARTRGESALVGFDLAGLVASAMGRAPAPASPFPRVAIGLGFDDDTTRIRFTMPTEQLNQLMLLAGVP